MMERWGVWIVAWVVVCAAAPGRALGQADDPDDARARQLRLEISDLREEEASVTQSGPAVMMVFGYVFAPMLLGGPMLLAIGDVGCHGDGDSDGCVDLTTAGWVLTGLGALGAGVGIAGLVMAIDRNDQRTLIRNKIKDRERELDSLSFDLHLGQHAAALRLRGTF